MGAKAAHRCAASGRLLLLQVLVLGAFGTAARAQSPAAITPVVATPVVVVSPLPLADPGQVRALAPPPEWVWRFADGAKPELRGAVERDHAGGGPGGLLYPVPNAVGLLIAVLTHAAINEGVRSAEETRLQEAASARVRAYLPVVDGLAVPALQALALQRAATLPVATGQQEAPPSAKPLQSQQVFVMALDGRSMALEAKVVLGSSGTAAADKLIRVVSNPLASAQAESGAGVEAVWLADGGRRLKDTMAELLAEMLVLAIADQPSDAALPQKTVRYLEGAGEKVERGTLLSQRCGRAVLRSLRGVLLSVPVRQAPSAAEACAQAAPLEALAPTPAAPPAGPDPAPPEKPPAPAVIS